MRLGLMMCVWKRPELTRIVQSYYSNIKLDGIELVKLAVLSPEDDEPVVKVDGWWRHYVANSPLADKHNAGMEWFRTQDIDMVMVIGSDDLVSENYFYFVRDCYLKGAHYIKPQSIYFYEVRKQEMFYIMVEHVGCGRVISCDALKAVNYRPWKDGEEKGLDRDIDSSLKASGHWRDKFRPWKLPDLRDIDAAIVDIKMPVTHMWSYENMKLAFRKNRIMVRPEGIFDKYFRNVMDDVFALTNG